ncbi:MAG TPA: hypothetical protein VLZ31_08040 [Microbacteriaceae bacterium]|nr:hypothetical protein [Microbacteriaceae bacterium]
MSIYTSIAAASEGAQVVNELPFPAPVFGAITLVIFIVMGLVTFSFRDVANRHSEKAEAYAREHGASNE